MRAKESMLAAFKAEPPSDYEDIFTEVVKILHDENDYGSPDPDRITVIDHGSYQGTKLFIVGADNYQPNEYWSCFVDYGSCSGCDSFQRVSDFLGDGDDADPSAPIGYWTLALHMVQNLKSLSGG